MELPYGLMGARLKTLSIMLVLLGLAGCVSLSATNKLKTGMSPQEVRQVMGEQNGTESVYGRTIWMYLFKREQVGFFLVFRDGKLDSWFSGVNEYNHAKTSWEHPGEPEKKAIEVNVR